MSAFPQAIKGTLNSLAFETRKKFQDKIRTNFVLRNKFTERSVRVNPVKTLKITDMEAETGSIAEYLPAQEAGETRRARGKYGLRIPTALAADQTGSVRTAPISRRFRRGKIKIGNKKIQAKSKKQFILMSIRVAALTGEIPYVFLPLRGKAAGVYRVTPRGSRPGLFFRRGKTRFRRKNKWGRPRGTPGQEKIRMIFSYAEKQIVINKTLFLHKSAEETQKDSNRIFEKEIDRQFHRALKK